MGFLDRFRKKPEVTPGGSPIYRYETPEQQGWRPPQDCGVYAEDVCAHFEKLFPDRETFVFHEIISDRCEHHAAPGSGRPLCSLYHRHERPAHDIAG